jgi:hypothetical protein
MTGMCYTSRDMVFEEASSWWSLDKKKMISYSKEFEERL